MEGARGHVAGADARHRIKLYGLSTCGWCRDAREFLTKRGVDFDYAYVDLLEGDELAATIEDVKRWNPGLVFPTVVVDDSEVVVGFRPERLEEVLGK
jgi:glutaredoxin-like protein NrdH